MRESGRMPVVQGYEVEKVPWLCFTAESAGTHFRFISCSPEGWKPVGSLPSAFCGRVPVPWRADFRHVPWRGDGAWQGTACQLQNESHKHLTSFHARAFCKHSPGNNIVQRPKGLGCSSFGGQDCTGTCKGQDFPLGDGRAAADGTCSQLGLG